MSARTFLLVAMLGVALTGCSAEETPAPPELSARITSGGMPTVFPASALRLEGDPQLVLAEGRHGIRLTLAEYNARVDEVPLPVDSDTTAARWQSLERLVAHKVCAAEGRLRGYVADDPAHLLDEDRQLVAQVVRQGMIEAQSIPDSEARDFFAEHPERFEGMTEEDLQTPAMLLHVKYTLHNQRWQEQIARWQEREEVVVHRVRFEELLRGSDSRTPNPSRQESKP